MDKNGFYITVYKKMSKVEGFKHLLITTLIRLMTLIIVYWTDRLQWTDYNYSNDEMSRRNNVTTGDSDGY